jgi:hypothetical protein
MGGKDVQSSSETIANREEVERRRRSAKISPSICWIWPSSEVHATLALLVCFFLVEKIRLKKPIIFFPPSRNQPPSLLRDVHLREKGGNAVRPTHFPRLAKYRIHTSTNKSRPGQVTFPRTVRGMPSSIVENDGSAARDYCMLERNFLAHFKVLWTPP